VNSNTFALINDPDHGTLSRLRNVFDALNSKNIKVTTAVFCTLENDNTALSKHCYRGETGALDEPEYADFMIEQREKGHEIAFHGYSQISNTREKFSKGLEIYKDIFGEYPFTYIEHGGDLKYHPASSCKMERLNWLGSTTDENSDYFIEDIIKDKINLTWAYFDLLDGPEIKNKNRSIGKIENLKPMKYEDLFYKKGDILLFKRWRSYYLDQMAPMYKQEENTMFLGYTHFGYDYYGINGYLSDNWVDRNTCFKTAEYLHDIINNYNFKNLTLKQIVQKNEENL